MPEQLDLYNPITRRSHPVNVHERKAVIGCAEGVELLSAEMMGRELRLVSKTPRLVATPKGAEELAEDRNIAAIYHRIWSRLKDAGLPVVPNLWTTSKEAVAMTDLTVPGGSFYDRCELHAVLDSRRKPKPIDQIFLSKSHEEIKTLGEAVLDHATSLGIAITPEDPMSLLVTPQKEFRVYLLDIGFTRFDHPKAGNINKLSLGRFMDRIYGLRDMLRK